MNDLYISQTLERYNRHQIRRLSVDVIRNEVDSSIRELIVMQHYNQACLADEPEHYFRNPIAFSLENSVSEQKSSHILLEESIEPGCLDRILQCSETLDDFIKLNTRFRKLIDSGNTLDSTYVNVRRRPITPRIKNVGSITMMKSIFGVTCIHCGQHHKFDSLADHQLSPACPIAADKKQMLDKGWVRLEDMAEIMATKRAGIETEAKVEHYGIWAPPWVKQALKSFRESGYAEMSLEEFLVKMKP